MSAGALHRTVRRRLAVALIVVACLGGGVAVAGCGATSHYLGAVVAHRLLGHFIHNPAALRGINKLFCLYHGHRVLVDVRHHHYFAAGLNGYSAYHACLNGFIRR